MKRSWPAAVLLIAILAAWEGAVGYFDVPRFLLPRPSRIAASLLQAASDLFGRHSRITLTETALGLLLAVSTGVITGMGMHLATWLRNAVYPLLVASQTVPIIVLAPLLVVWFGYGMLPKLLLVTIACFFPVAIAVTDGLASAPEAKLRLMRAMGATPWQQFWYVNVPHAAPAFFTGLRVATTYAVMAAVVAEWMGADAGLGIYIVRSAHSFRTEHVFAGMMVVTLYSVLLFVGVGILRRYALPWEQYVIGQAPTTIRRRQKPNERNDVQ